MAGPINVQDEAVRRERHRSDDKRPPPSGRRRIVPRIEIDRIYSPLASRPEWPPADCNEHDAAAAHRIAHSRCERSKPSRTKLKSRAAMDSHDSQGSRSQACRQDSGDDFSQVHFPDKQQINPQKENPPAGKKFLRSGHDE